MDAPKTKDLVPCLVQPGGAVLVLSADAGTVLGASEGMEAFTLLPAAAAIGKKLGDCLPWVLAEAIEARSRSETPSLLSDAQPGLIALLAPRPVGDGVRLLELLPDLGRTAPADPTLPRHLGPVQAAALVARRLLRLGGCDQVVVLRLEPDGSAEIIAEAAGPHGLPAIGLRQPELPASTRARLGMGHKRLILDATATPRALLGEAPDGTTPFRLRAPSPALAARLRLQGTVGQLVVPILAGPSSGSRLWGWIVCRSASPLLPGIVLRSGVAGLARSLGRLCRRDAAARDLAHRRRLNRAKALLARPEAEQDPLPLLLRPDGLASWIDASGLALLGPGLVLASGSVPEPAWLGSFQAWLGERAGPLATARLAGCFPAPAPPAAAALAVEVKGLGRLAAFRAGNIAERLWTEDPGGDATPLRLAEGGPTVWLSSRGIGHSDWHEGEIELLEAAADFASAQRRRLLRAARALLRNAQRGSARLGPFLPEPDPDEAVLRQSETGVEFVRIGSRLRALLDAIGALPRDAGPDGPVLAVAGPHPGATRMPAVPGPLLALAPGQGPARLVTPDGQVLRRSVRTALLLRVGQAAVDLGVLRLTDQTAEERIDAARERALRLAECQDRRLRETARSLPLELGVPIAAIRGYARQLSAGQGQKPEAIGLFARAIDAAASQLGALVEARSQAPSALRPGPGLREEVVDLGHALDEAIRLAAPLAADRPVGLERLPPRGALRLLASRAVLVEALSQLITASIEAVPPAGSLSIRAFRNSSGQGVVELVERVAGSAGRSRALRRPVWPDVRSRGRLSHASAEASGRQGLVPAWSGPGLGVQLARSGLAAMGGLLSVRTEEAGWTWQAVLPAQRMLD